MENLTILVNQLRLVKNENNWLEFKHNNYEPDMIGKDISALANGAAYSEKSCAYMLWGIDDKTHEIVGTDFDQHSLKINNQEIESWLRTMLSKNANFEFQSVEIEGKKVVVLIVYKALNYTVTFKKVEYIRVGSYTKQLNEYSGLQAQVWDKIRMQKFEQMPAFKHLTLKKALDWLDYSVYFELLQIPMPTSMENISYYLLEDDIIVKQNDGLYQISNLGAILFAKRLSLFKNIDRKAIRIVQYRGNDRLNILKEYTGQKGYAVGFTGLMDFLEGLLPSYIEVEGALRKEYSKYPMKALREIIANALIHQDFSIAGTGPLVEIFDSRIEVTNPGVPLVDIDRIINNPPKSRNEKLASLMRRLKMCEELGTGWDKIAACCEQWKLPAPKILLYEENTKVYMYSDMKFSDISQEDKIRACYLHACLKNVSNDGLTNRSLRERFGLATSSSASVSRLIKDTVDAKLIKPIDPNTAPRHMKYIPFWA